MIRIFAVLGILASLSAPAYAEQISVAAWNVEDFDFGGRNPSDGSDGARIASQLRDEFHLIDIFALSEVGSRDTAEVFSAIAAQDEKSSYVYVIGNTGNSIRLAVLVNSARFEFTVHDSRTL